MAGQTGSTYITESLAQGNANQETRSYTYYVSVVSAQGCEGPREAITATIYRSEYQANGDAAINGTNCYRLTMDNTNRVGSIWRTMPIDLNKSFEVSFTANFGSRTTGADGIAFGLQRRVSNPLSAVGNIGEALGFGGISPSVAVEFDTYQNANEPAYDHIAFFRNGNQNAPVAGTQVQMSNAKTNVKDGQDYQVRVVWSKEMNKMEVYFNGVYRTSYTADIVNEVFAGNPQVYFGFTASTGTYRNLQSVCSIVYNIAPEAHPVTSNSVPSKPTAKLLSPLHATDEDGTIASYTILSLPARAQGTLYVNGTQAAATDLPLTLTPAQAQQLSFMAANGFSGSVTFTYTATDNLGAVDATPATYAVPVIFDGDEDGVPDHLDLDKDNDGIPDAVEGTGDKDGDGIPNHLDLDADGDGILDAVEANGGLVPSDAVFDVLTGRYTGPVGANGLVDALESSVDSGALRNSPPDTDGDGLPDFLDLDSDDDGVSDNQEAQEDLFFLVRPSGQDADSDGVDDRYDGSCGCAVQGTPLVPVNSDGDRWPDYRDTDADNDGTPDEHEAHDNNVSGSSADDLRQRAIDFTANATGAAKGYYPTDGPEIVWLQDTDENGVSDYLQFGSAHYHDTNSNGWVDLFEVASYAQERRANPAYRDGQSIVPLPVTLMSFTAQVREGQVLLSWATATEVNNAYFAVERSRDGKSFEQVARVKGAGNSSVRLDYALLDGRAPAGVVYYRLRQVDFDGQHEYSKIVAVRVREVEPEVRVYPNPASSTLLLNLRSLPDGEYTLRVVSMDGRVVKEATVAGGEEAALDVSQLPTGNYVLQLQGEQLARSLKFIKQ